MQAIDEAMRKIGDLHNIGNYIAFIRQQLEKVAKAARREALLKAADYFGGGEPHWDPDSLEVEKELRRMAEEAT